MARLVLIQTPKCCLNPTAQPIQQSNIMSFRSNFQIDAEAAAPPMAKLEDLTRGAAVKGILPDCLVTVIDVKWYGSAAIELTYKDPAGKPNVVLLYRDREPTLEIGRNRPPVEFRRRREAVSPGLRGAPDQPRPSL